MSSDDQRRWEYSEIKDILGLNDAELGSAIGWLAREDKIQFELEHHNSKDEKAYLYLMLNALQIVDLDMMGEVRTVHPCREVGTEKNKKYDIMAIISESSIRSDIGKS